MSNLITSKTADSTPAIPAELLSRRLIDFTAGELLDIIQAGLRQNSPPPTVFDMDTPVSPEEACILLGGISMPSLLNLRKAGKLKGSFLGNEEGVVKYRPSELKAYLDSITRTGLSKVSVSANTKPGAARRGRPRKGQNVNKA